VDLTQKFFKEPVAGLLKDGNKVATIKPATGRGLVGYFNDTIYPAGGFTQVAEAGSYAASQTESEQQPNITLRLYGLTVGYNEHALTALEQGGRKLVMSSVKKKLRQAVEHTQRRMTRLLLGRGDGMVARVTTGATATSFVSSIPIHCVIGDLISANPGAGAGDERGLGGSDSISSVRITDIDYITNTITLASSQTFATDDIVYIANAAHNAGGAGVYPHGIQAMCDNGDSDNSWQWDADDDTTYDHVDTYLGLTRSTLTQANVSDYNASSTSPDINMFSSMFNAIAYKGADPENLFVLIHPTTYQAYADTLVGTAPRSVKTKLPGGTYSLPMIDGVGQGNIKAIVDPGLPTDKIVMLDASKYYKLTAKGGWNMRSGNLWKQGYDTSGSATTTVASLYNAVFDIWLAVALNLPNTSCVAYAVTTT
jgi:hypothetical protein